MARNILIILIALNFPPAIASDMILHLWYSAFLTESIVHSIKNTILPIIQEDLRSKRLNAQGKKLGAIWTYQKTNLSAEFDRKTWNLVLAYCQGNQPFSFDDAGRLRRLVTLAASRQDYIDRAMFQLPPFMACCESKVSGRWDTFTVWRTAWRGQSAESVSSFLLLSFKALC